MLLFGNEHTVYISNVRKSLQSLYTLQDVVYGMEDSLNELLGPSNYLLVLEMFLENPGQWMNLREIARRVNKNAGSISHVVKNLLKRGLIIDCKVGLVSAVYQLNCDNEKVQALLNLRNALKK